MEFKGKRPDHTASYLADKADREKRGEVGKRGKKLTPEQRKKLGQDPKFTDKRLKYDQN